MFLNSDGCSVLCASESDADKLFAEPAISAMAAHDIHPILPLALKAKRSVIVKNVDSLVYDNEVAEIKHEIEDENSWADVQEIIKFANSNTLKITFRTADRARSALPVDCFSSNSAFLGN